jgi:MFS transporter, DHA1 family, tetracycline resistance protein
MRRTPGLAFLLVTVFVDMLGLGLIVPIIPSLMTAITGHAASGARWSGVIDSSTGSPNSCSLHCSDGSPTGTAASRC